MPPAGSAAAHFDPLAHSPQDATVPQPWRYTPSPRASPTPHEVRRSQHAASGVLSIQYHDCLPSPLPPHDVKHVSCILRETVTATGQSTKHIKATTAVWTV